MDDQVTVSVTLPRGVVDGIRRIAQANYLTKLSAVVLTPVSGLLGAVVGFYYGEQSGRR